jgi:hypothetical protein
VQKLRDIGAGKDAMAPGSAEPFKPADQVAGRNVALQRLDVHIEQPRRGRRADGDFAGKRSLERAIDARFDDGGHGAPPSIFGEKDKMLRINCQPKSVGLKNGPRGDSPGIRRFQISISSLRHSGTMASR